MRIRHLFPTATSRATVEGDRAFLLRNQLGDFLSLFTTSQTRYAGWFLAKEKAFYKVLESLVVLSEEGAPIEVVGITNVGHTIAWEYEDGTRLFWQLHPNQSGITAVLSQPRRLRITLDVRDIYARPEFGREYSVNLAEPTLCRVAYKDPSLGQPLHIAIKSREPLELVQQWETRSYPRDTARHSEPDQASCFVVAESLTGSLSIGAHLNYEESLKAVQAAAHLPEPPITLTINTSHDTLLTHMRTAKIVAEEGLRLLQSQNGLYAGLPWFHQVWARDELIAALGYTKEEQHQVIEEYLGHELLNGELETYKGSHSTCADGIGWLCLVVAEYGLTNLPPDTKVRLMHFLKNAHSGLVKNHQASHGLIASGHNATWMDTIGREGFRVDIQAMFSLLLQQLHELTGDESYSQERLRFLATVRHLLFKDGYLMDGLDDPTKRPNVFLAYLLEPELLSQKNWTSCFDSVLEVLRCGWGGLSSIDQTDPRFQAVSTGEDNKSYHNGDSWFFVNNLAAIAMHRLNQRHFGQDIVTLLQSSTNEILWEHMVGQPGEISSASRLDSWGCGLQAFSAGAYLALLKELEHYSARQGADASESFWESTAR